MTEHGSAHGQRPDDTENDDEESPERETFGEYLKRLRGDRTLRQVENGTGIANSYLSNLEMGHKRPGRKSLLRLARYYGVPFKWLMTQSPRAFEFCPADREDVERCYEFVLSDPKLALYEKPVEAPSVDTQQFVVRLYEHYTGKKLL